MKRVFLVLLSFCIVSSVFAQTSGKITISQSQVQWECPNQIVSSERGDTVYVAFGNDSVVILVPNVIGLKRAELKTLLTADKKIFAQVPHSSPVRLYDHAGMLVHENGSKIGIAKVILKKLHPARFAAGER